MNAPANEVILANFGVNTRWTSYKQALKEGVTALFSESTATRCVSSPLARTKASVPSCVAAHTR